MSAMRRGIKRVKILSGILHALKTVMGEAINDVKAMAAQHRSRRQQQLTVIALHQINDHALRDIGLVRDRFSGVILDDAKGDVVSTLPDPLSEAATSVKPAYKQGVKTPGYNGRERRSSERRQWDRRADNRNGQEPARPDRRAYDRRAQICEVLDCRHLFYRRSPRLLT